MNIRRNSIFAVFLLAGTLAYQPQARGDRQVTFAEGTKEQGIHKVLSRPTVRKLYGDAEAEPQTIDAKASTYEPQRPRELGDWGHTIRVPSLPTSGQTKRFPSTPPPSLPPSEYNYIDIINLCAMDVEIEFKITPSGAGPESPMIVRETIPAMLTGRPSRASICLDRAPNYCFNMLFQARTLRPTMSSQTQAIGSNMMEELNVTFKGPDPVRLEHRLGESEMWENDFPEGIPSLLENSEFEHSSSGRSNITLTVAVYQGYSIITMIIAPNAMAYTPHGGYNKDISSKTDYRYPKTTLFL